MGQTVINGKNGSITGVPCKIAAWRLRGNTVSLETSGFGDAGYRTRIAGLQDAVVSASGFLTKGTTTDDPGFPTAETAVLSLVLTADSSCTFTLSAIGRMVDVGVAYREAGAIAIEADSTGSITKAWVTT